MEQEVTVMNSEGNGVIIRKDTKGEMVYIRIIDEGKDIEFATENKVFLQEMKRFVNFDELKHLYE